MSKTYQKGDEAGRDIEAQMEQRHLQTDRQVNRQRQRYVTIASSRTPARACATQMLCIRNPGSNSPGTPRAGVLESIDSPIQPRSGESA